MAVTGQMAEISPKIGFQLCTFSNRRFQLKSIKQLQPCHVQHICSNLANQVSMIEGDYHLHAHKLCQMPGGQTCTTPLLGIWPEITGNKKLSSKILLGSTPRPRMQGCQSLLDQDYEKFYLGIPINLHLWAFLGGEWIQITINRWHFNQPSTTNWMFLVFRWHDFRWFQLGDCIQAPHLQP